MKKEIRKQSSHDSDKTIMLDFDYSKNSYRSIILLSKLYSAGLSKNNNRLNKSTGTDPKRVRESEFHSERENGLSTSGIQTAYTKKNC